VITWTLTEDVEPPGAPPGSTFVEVNGVADDPNSPHQDPHDARHFPNMLAALAFLLNHKCKRGDTIHVEGADTGRILRVGYVRVGDAIEFDVGTRQIPDPASLLEWLSTTIQKGDTVVYLPMDSGEPNGSPE
jgi:hypothetical protein